ncbi:H-NS family nucleoid-associated regulatory protein [Variovorax sp. PvP013]|uniref:H-NS family nucleoid-associated regulatory protein n=1 Tax=Variovorax sp. PvP013 TaxID=3156435 RepID=UPI003D1B811E
MTKTYAQLTREIQALQASAEKLRAAEVKAVIAKLNESIAAYELTADDLHFPGSTSSSGGRRAASAATSSSRSDASKDAKYSDGQGNTWGGRGPRPAWLRQAISNGRSLESFETSGKESRFATAASGNAKSQAAASKVKLPPLYGHPKTGQTWSGRGPKPTWLKQGLKKRGTSIDDFLISASTSAPAEAAAPVAAPARPQNARAKPAAATKKSLAEKVAARSKSSSDAKPVAAAKPASAAPVKKAGVDGQATGKSAARPAAKKTKAAPAAGAAAGTTAASAPAKKVAAKPAAVKPAAVKPAAKPSAKTAGAPRKNLPSSMAPSADAAPTPSTVPAAAPMPAPQSDSVEGRGDTAGA